MIVREITDSYTLRVIVAVRDVAFRKWRFYENGIFDDATGAVPYKTLIRGVNLNKVRLFQGEKNVPRRALPMQALVSSSSFTECKCENRLNKLLPPIGSFDA